MRNTAITIVLLALFSGITTAQSISEWRPENRTGVSAETGLMKSWPESGPGLVWENLTLPRGHSSVSFGNSFIYLTGLEDNNEVLVALDNSGKIKWKTTYGRCWQQSNPESRCNPTVEGNRVYVSSGFGDIACIDGILGKIIWSVKASELYKGTYAEWGIAESLIIDGQKLYFTPGGSETTTIALDKTSGKLIWKSKSLNDNPAYVSPILINYAGKKIIVNVSANYIFGIDASNGILLWNVKHTDAIDSKKSVAIWPDAPFIKCVTPVFSDGKIFVTGGYDHGSILLNLNKEGTNVSVKWTDQVLDVHHGGVVLVNGYLFGSNWLNNNDGNWCCLDWNTGEKKWEEHWKCKGSIISAEGLLYIYDERSGFVGLVNANPAKFDLISSFKIKKGSGPYWALPVIHDGILYLRHTNALMAYNIKAK
jgi:outer membrane protein assembly factor BamB